MESTPEKDPVEVYLMIQKENNNVDYTSLLDYAKLWVQGITYSEKWSTTHDKSY